MTNIYHLCIAKTGSQWIKGMFKHPYVQRATNMPLYNFERDRHIWDSRNFMSRHESKFPENTICSPTYMGFNCFTNLPKPKQYKAFSVIRDPRDIVVSFYFSTRYSHGQLGKHPVWREQLSKLNKSQGLNRAIELMHGMKMFKAILSHARGKDENYRVMRYEDLIGGNQFEQFYGLFTWLGIDIGRKKMRTILDANSFESKTGRTPGQENKRCHRRKGISGDWKNHFDSCVEKKFYQVTGDLTKKLEYE